MHFRVFSEGQDTEWRIIFGLLNFSNWGDLFIFLGGWGGVISGPPLSPWSWLSVPTYPCKMQISGLLS